MKKPLSFILVVILIFSSFSVCVTATAQVVPREGDVFVVTHKNPLYPTSGVTEKEKKDNHVTATSLLCQQIEAITYAEIIMFDIDTLYVGLPYDAVDKVKALDTVISVKPYTKSFCSSKAPKDKIEPKLSTLVEESSPDDIIKSVMVDFAYDNMVYYGFCKEDFDTSGAYLQAKRAVDKAYHKKTNNLLFADVQSKIDAQLKYCSSLSTFVVIDIKASEIEKLSQMPQVAIIYAPQKEEPYDSPTEIPSQVPTESHFKYKDKFNEWIKFEEYDPKTDDGQGTFGKYFDYDELYEHKDENGNADWALITAKVDLSDPWEVVDTVKIGNRIVKWWQVGSAAFGFSYAIYDAKQDTFIDLAVFKENVYKGVDIDSFEGLAEIFETLNIGGSIGDVDMDNEISVLDATEIQLYLTDLKDYVAHINPTEYIHALADVDNDAHMTVMDATAIQKQLVGIG